MSAYKARVTYYMYLLDCHISTLYAVPPRIPVMEMQTCLPSDDVAFSEKGIEICQPDSSHGPSSRCLSLVDVVQKLMGEDWNSTIKQELAGATTFAMFLTISGKHHPLAHRSQG